MLQRVASLILGVHPNNTCFSFNWHNIRHINKFLKKQTLSLRGRKLIIADVGGGKSPYFFHFSAICDNYIVVDLKASLPKGEQRPIKQVEGVAEDIPLEDSSVDIVLCNQVLEHVFDPVKSVAEIYRILKPGGCFLGSVPHVSPIHLEPNDFRRYTLPGVKQLLESNGFRQVSVEGNGGVFTTAAFMISMDLLLSQRQENRPQKFHSKLSFMLFPLVGFMNVSGLLADKIMGDKGRTPANLCWSAIKG